MEQLDPYLMAFIKFDIRGFFFRKSVEKIQVSLKSDDNNRYFRWRPIYILHHSSLNCSYNRKCFGQTSYRKSNHILCSVPPENRAVCEMNVDKYDNIVCRMRSACWISKTTNTIKMRNIYCRSTTVVRRTRLSITLYVHCLTCSFPVSLINPHSGSCCPLNRAPTHEAECRRQINEACQIKQRSPYKFVSADTVILFLLSYFKPYAKPA
jgi:hypothetical protein